MNEPLKRAIVAPEKPKAHKPHKRLPSLSSIDIHRLDSGLVTAHPASFSRFRLDTCRTTRLECTTRGTKSTLSGDTKTVQHLRSRHVHPIYIEKDFILIKWV